MKYIESFKLEGKIKLLSGLHIGGNKDKIEIGGINSPVIKHPISGLPYIPGSSIKGKMRFLLEWALGKVDPKDKGKPHSCGKPECPICRIFGCTHDDRVYGPTRIQVQDCALDISEGKKGGYDDGKWNPYEEKVENSINRLSGTAIHPRHIERVAAEECFEFGLTYKIFEIDNENEGNNINIDEVNWQYIIEALYLLQEDALGGSGSRGYGKIKFESLTLFKDGSLQEDTYEIGKQGDSVKLIPVARSEENGKI